MAQTQQTDPAAILLNRALQLIERAMTYQDRAPANEPDYSYEMAREREEAEEALRYERNERRDEWEI